MALVMDSGVTVSAEVESCLRRGRSECSYSSFGEYDIIAGCGNGKAGEMGLTSSRVQFRVAD